MTLKEKYTEALDTMVNPNKVVTRKGAKTLIDCEIQPYVNYVEQKLQASEKARKEAIELINNINDWEICSKYDCIYQDDVLEILKKLDIDKGE